MVTVLITGGTGFFGTKLTEYLIGVNTVKKIIIFSRDEHKQNEMAKKFNTEKLRFFIGDVRDVDRLTLAMQGVDRVIHAAALKVVPSCEYNPMEAIRTNVFGTENVVKACIRTRVKRATFISTDKAVEPSNLYGVTKAAAEKLWVHANAYSEIFDVMRFGNVMGSTGSILPMWLKIYNKWISEASEAKKAGRPKPDPIFPVTDERMTRFWLDPNRAVKFVWETSFIPGSVNIPIMKGFKIIKLLSAVYKRAIPEIVGIRKGEKLHETIISEHELTAARMVEQDSMRYYRIHEQGKGYLIGTHITSANAEQMNVDDIIRELK